MVKFAGYDYDIPRFVTIKNITIDTDKVNIFPNDENYSESDRIEAEFVRLYLDCLPIPEREVTNIIGDKITLPEKKGIDLTTASISEIKTFLNDETIKKSNAIISLCEKIIYLKSETDVDLNTRKQFSDEQKTVKNNIEFLGKSGMK